MNRNPLNIGKAEATVRKALFGLALIASAMLPLQAAFAATQTQSLTSCTTLGGGGANWTTPERAASSDNVYATANVDGTVTDPLQCLNYGFSIPDGATILGIEVNVERRSNSTANGGSRDNSLQLVKAGAAVGANRATATTYTTADVVETHGTASDLWGTTWTPADINAANFGAQFTATKPSGTGAAHTVSVDQIQITVTYSTASQTQSQVSCTTPGGGGANWTTPELAASSDNAYATASVDGTVTNPLQCLNYGFSIPTGSTIDGIEVNVERKASNTNNGGSRDSSLQLVKAGTVVGANRATATTYTTADVIETHGTPTDLWGTTWTPADINAANFGAVFAATKPSATGGAHTVSVDQIQITVTYRPPTTLGDGANPGNVTIAPSAAITDLDAFTLVTSEGTDSVTALTVTLTGANSFQGLSEVRITDSTGAITYFSAVTNPASNTVLFSGGTPIPVTTTITTFKVRITPKTHANMPVPPGATYTVGGTVTAFTSTNPQLGSDGASATVTIDNLSPNSASAITSSAGNAYNTLNWTTSNSADFATTAGSIVYRWASASAGSEVPAEGSTPTIGSTNGTATVACVVNSAASTALTRTDGSGGSADCTTTALTTTQAYTYKIFQKDANGNYDVGVAMGTLTPGPAVINTYYPGNTASVPAGATSIALGAATGDTTPIAIGDTVLIIQMQDAVIDSSNTSSYGTTSAVGAGTYEYAVAGSAVPLSGGTLTIACGTRNAYNNAAATGTAGQRTYQVIRVPANASYTVPATGLTTLPWNGSTGGVLIFDVSGVLTLNNGTLDVSGMGFRGGAARQLTGGAGSNTDYVTLATVNTNGSKGEGIAGTPRYMLVNNALLNTGVEGYPNGSHARGAPANGGGGGTDGDPAANDQNPGGGGGANYGAGGIGGIAWCSSFNATVLPAYNCPDGSHPNNNFNSGGIGGYSLSTLLTASRLVLGGGGGGGTTNNGTGTPAGGLASSGAAGGGIIMVRAGSVSGSATFNANGSNANNTVLNDGGGGAGAGGTVMVFASSGGMAGITANAKGGIGGTNTGTGVPHGPGGGGGGGYVVTSSATTCSASGGASGVTQGTGSAPAAYGAAPGAAGSCSSALTAAQIPGTILGATSCGPHHYELSVPASSVSCLATPVTITACSDSSNPCTSVATTTAGTVSLATTGGTIVTPATIASGVGNSTLSYPSAADGTIVTVSLTGASTPGQTATTCRGGGGGCTTTFNTAGFIFSTTPGGAATNIANQVSGVASATYYLRAVKTSTTTQACEPALQGTNVPVDFGYECNNPTTCSGSNLMALNGNHGSTIIARNNNGSVTSYLSVGMDFDANGNAPFTLNFSDVGQIKLYASKAASGSLLTTLTGSTNNPFTVKPYSLVLTDIKQTASPNTANPAAADASGTVFVKASEKFSATVTAVNASCAASLSTYTTVLSIPAACITPNYGKETAAEGAKITGALVTGLGFTNNPAINNNTAFGGFTSGSATGTTFSWDEVGIVKLTPDIADGDYLGAGSVSAATTVNVGRFIPDHFDLSGGAIVNRSDVNSGAGCVPTSTFSYMGEPMAISFTLTAMNGVAPPATAVTQNYAGSFAKFTNNVFNWTTFGVNDGIGLWMSASGYAVSPGTCNVAFSNATPSVTSYACTGVANPVSINRTAGPRVTVGTSPAMSWAAGVGAFSANVTLERADSPDGPYNMLNVGAAPQDADGVKLSSLNLDTDNDLTNDRQLLVTSAARYGRLRLSNAYGSELLNLSVPVLAEYVSGFSGTTPIFAANNLDSCTAISSTAVALSNLTLSSTTVAGGTTTLSGGQGFIRLNKPTGATVVGTVDMALNLGITGTALDASCNASHPGTTAANLPWLQYGWCSGKADPNARVKFGSSKTPFIYLRERY